MHHTQAHFGSMEQWFLNVFITRASVWQQFFEVGVPLDVGKSLRGVAMSFAVDPSDFRQGFGKDVVIPGGPQVKTTDICFPAGVLVDDIIIAKDPMWNTWARVVAYGFVDRVYTAGSGVTNQVIATLGNTSGNGQCSVFSLGEFVAPRAIKGNGTLSPITGAFSMVADAASMDWTNIENAPIHDTLAPVAVGVAGGVPSAGMGMVGITPRVDTVIHHDAATNAGGGGSRPCFVMCMGGSVGRL